MWENNNTNNKRKRNTTNEAPRAAHTKADVWQCQTPTTTGKEEKEEKKESPR